MNAANEESIIIYLFRYSVYLLFVCMCMFEYAPCAIHMSSTILAAAVTVTRVSRGSAIFRCVSNFFPSLPFLREAPWNAPKPASTELAIYLGRAPKQCRPMSAPAFLVLLQHRRRRKGISPPPPISCLRQISSLPTTRRDTATSRCDPSTQAPASTPLRSRASATRATRA